MSVELPHFNTVIPNNVYDSIFAFDGSDGRLVYAKELLIVDKYSKPTQEEVLDVLQETAEKLISSTVILFFPIPQKPIRIVINYMPETRLEAAVANLSHLTIGKIAKHDQEMIERSKVAIPEYVLTDSDDKGEFLRINHGILRMEDFERQEALLETAENYESLILSKSMRAYLSWYKQIPLCCGELTHIPELSLQNARTNIPLTEEETKYWWVQHAFQTVTDTFQDKTNIDQLADISQKVLDYATMLTAQKLMSSEQIASKPVVTIKKPDDWIKTMN